MGVGVMRGKFLFELIPESSFLLASEKRRRGI